MVQWYYSYNIVTILLKGGGWLNMKLFKHSFIYFLAFVVLIGLTSTFTSKEFIDQPSKVSLTGQDMMQMQIALNGGNVSMTEEATKEQENADGKDTEEEKEKNALIEELEKEPAYKNGDKDPKIMEYQDTLIQLEYLNGNPDGSFGDMTEWAILEFQKDEGLEETGILDLETKSALKNKTTSEKEEQEEVEEQDKSEDQSQDQKEDQQESSGDSDVTEHTVKSGETFSHISAQYDISIDALLEANDLSETSLIDIGQTLVIPQD